MPNMPINFCRREEIGGKFAITPIIACMSFLRACELADGNFLERARLCNELSGCDNCPGLTQADADKSAKQQLLPSWRYEAKAHSAAIQRVVWLKCNTVEYNYGRASLIYHWLHLVGPAGPANCSFLLAAQFSSQFLPKFPPRQQYPPPSPQFNPPWLLTLLGRGMRHLTGTRL